MKRQKLKERVFEVFENHFSFQHFCPPQACGGDADKGRRSHLDFLVSSLDRFWAKNVFLFFTKWAILMRKAPRL